MTGLSDWKCVFQKLSFPKQRRHERKSEVRMAADFGLDSAFTSAEVKDISTGGVYLATETRLRTGELINLTLREVGRLGDNSELQFSIHARVVRQGKDGIGLAFVLPPGLEANLWEALVRNIITLTESKEITKMFRMLRFILFLCRICQPGAQEPLQLLGELANERVETLIKIALDAEKQLVQQPDFECRRAHPKLVANILREGSWATDELTIQLWTGLLVSSCFTDAPQNSNQAFVDLLTQVPPASVRIFTYACERALRSVAEGDNSSPTPIVITPDDLTALTGVSDLSKIAGNVTHLSDLGLLQNAPYFRSYGSLDGIDIAPTCLGMELYKHCHGISETASEPGAQQELDQLQLQRQ